MVAVLDRIDNAERGTITREGEGVAVLIPPADAASCLALADRFRVQRRPFTQAALDAWLDDVLAGRDLGALMEVRHVRPENTRLQLRWHHAEGGP